MEDAYNIGKAHWSIGNARQGALTRQFDLAQETPGRKLVDREPATRGF
jgi:hypothetical protein